MRGERRPRRVVQDGQDVERELLAESHRDRDGPLGVQVPDVVRRPGDEACPATGEAAPALEASVERIGSESALERRLGDRDAPRTEPKIGGGIQQRNEQRERELRIRDEELARLGDNLFGESRPLGAAVLATPWAERRKATCAVALDPAIQRGTRDRVCQSRWPPCRYRTDARGDLAADIVGHRAQDLDDLVVAPLRNRPRIERVGSSARGHGEYQAAR